MKRRQDGVALVLVLWVITLLTVIAGNFAYSMRGEAQIARNLLSTAQAQARADAGVQLAWFELLKPPSEALRWQGNGAVHEMLQGGVLLQVSILDESGKIDLNTASDELLKGLFKSAGLDDSASAALSAAVLDWRSPGDLKRLNGAKEPDYRAAGKNYGPPNAPFETVDELQRVLGMTPALYRQLAPALTIYSRQAGINTSVAPREALLAIPGANPAMVEQFLAQRQEALANGQPVPAFSGAGTFSSGGNSQTYRVRSQASVPDGSIFVRQAIGRLSGNAKSPIQLVAWGEGDTQPPVLNNAMAKN